jgi:hypothetical protein
MAACTCVGMCLAFKRRWWGVHATSLLCVVCADGAWAAQCNWRFELANILFNLGALESVAACSISRGTPEGIKEACQHFQVCLGSCVCECECECVCQSLVFVYVVAALAACVVRCRMRRASSSTSGRPS